MASQSEVGGSASGVGGLDVNLHSRLFYPLAGGTESDKPPFFGAGQAT